MYKTFYCYHLFKLICSYTLRNNLKIQSGVTINLVDEENHFALISLLHLLKSVECLYIELYEVLT